MRNDGWREILFQHRNELFANARAQAFRVAIGGVFAPGLMERFQIVAQILALDFEQRPDHGADRGIDTRQSAWTCSADQMCENCFGLVLRGVSYGDASRLSSGADALEEGVAKASRCVFEIPTLERSTCGDVLAGGYEFQIKLAGQVFDELRIRCGVFATQLVIEMDDEKRDAQVLANILEDAQQSDGIRAARNGHTNAIAGRNHLRCADAMKDRLFEGGFHGRCDRRQPNEIDRSLLT